MQLSKINNASTARIVIVSFTIFFSLRFSIYPIRKKNKEISKRESLENNEEYRSASQLFFILTK
jgi:hypothetical protein